MPDGTSTAQRQRAEALLTFLTENILNKYSKSEISTLAWEKFSTRQQMKSVVVVGEVSRGKSSLANALVGVKDASPVGVNFTTAVSVGLGAGSEDSTPNSAQLFYSDHEESVSRDQLEEYINEHQQAARLRNGEDVPTRAFIPLTSSSIDAVVIDTPGVGGLDPSHTKLAATSAEQASVLVVVCDASSPLTAPEMEFIKATGRHIDNIVVAVTKIDKHFSRWEQIVANDKALLKKHLGRTVPVVGVSSLLDVYSDPNLPDAEIDRIHQASGVPELRRQIVERFAAAENFPAINGLRVALEGLRDLNEELNIRKDSISQAEDALPELNTQLAKLQDLKKDLEQWEQYLNRDLTLSRQKAGDFLDTKLEEIRQKWLSTINREGMKVLRQSSQHYTAQIEKDFQEIVLSTLGVFTTDIEERIVKPRFKSNNAWEEISQEIALGFSDRELQTTEVKKKTDGIFDPMMLLMGASGGSIIGAALGAVVSFSGLGLVAGAGWVAFNVGFRAMRSGKQNLVNWVQQTVAATRMFTNRLLEAGVANARPAIVIRYREYIRKAIDQTQQQISTAQKSANMETKHKAASLQRLDRNMEIISKNIARAETMIEELKSSAKSTDNDKAER